MPSHVGHKHKTWILLQRLSKPVQDFDDDPAVWETVYTIRATVTPVRSDERTEGPKIKEGITHTVEIRWMPDVTTEWRVVIEDGTKATDDEKRILHIDGLLDWKDQRKYLQLDCTEING